MSGAGGKHWERLRDMRKPVKCSACGQYHLVDGETFTLNKLPALQRILRERFHPVHASGDIACSPEDFGAIFRRVTAETIKKGCGDGA